MNSRPTPDDKPKLPKRRIVVRMTSREQTDPLAVLNAVQNSLSGHGITLQIRTVGAKEPDPASPPVAEPVPVVKDEPLESEARKLAQQVLADKTAESAKARVEKERDAELVALEVVAARKGFWAYFGYWAGQGVKITVGVYKKVADGVADTVGAVFGKKKE